MKRYKTAQTLDRWSSILINSGRAPGPVICFVGAGASHSAGIPLGNELADRIWREFTGHGIREPGGRLQNALKKELSNQFEKAPEEAGLFEIGSVIAHLAHGRNAIQKTITEQISSPSHRPLAYELLAHLARHGHIDHVISMNFDSLLDEAIEEECKDLQRVVSERNLPANIDERQRWYIKPFGTYGRGTYDISAETVELMGTRFLHAHIKDHLFSTKPRAILLLGYKAAEKGFAQLYEGEKLQDVPFLIVDTNPRAKRDFEQRFPTARKVSQSSTMGCDDAMDALLQTMESKWVKRRNGKHSWIPPARHRLFSMLGHANAKRGSSSRFECELMLQGIKSRGFVHLESFASVRRLRSNTSPRAGSVAINTLLDRGIIEHEEWIGEAGQPISNQRYFPAFGIPADSKVRTRTARHFLSYVPPRVPVSRVTIGSQVYVRPIDGSRKREEFVLEQFEAIEKAPDIEISRDAAPETGWLLQQGATPLDSVSELIEATEELLHDADSRHGILGVWATGEWLFSGWASSIYRKKLKNRVNIDAVITRELGTDSRRAEMRRATIEEISGPASRRNRKLSISTRPWWEVNRVLTIVKGRGGVYMRRRLNAPLVQPYRFSARTDAYAYSIALWKRYEKASKAVDRGAAARADLAREPGG